MLPGNNSTREMAQCVYIPCHLKRCKGRVKETEKGRKVERREGGGDLVKIDNIGTRGR